MIRQLNSIRLYKVDTNVDLLKGGFMIRLADRCKLEGVELQKKKEISKEKGVSMYCDAKEARAYNQGQDSILNLQVPEPREALDRDGIFLMLVNFFGDKPHKDMKWCFDASSLDDLAHAICQKFGTPKEPLKKIAQISNMEKNYDYATQQLGKEENQVWEIQGVIVKWLDFCPTGLAIEIYEKFGTPEEPLERLDREEIIELLKSTAFEWIKGKNLLRQKWEFRELWEQIAVILIANKFGKVKDKEC